MGSIEGIIKARVVDARFALSGKIVDTSSYYFEIEIEQKDIPDFLEPKKCKLEIVGVKEEILGESKKIFSDGKKFLIQVPIANNPEVFLGLNGKANF